MMIASNKQFHVIARSFYKGFMSSRFTREYVNDLALIQTIEKCLKVYDKSGIGGLGKTDTRILLNSYQIFVNMFGVVADNLLRFKIPQELHSYLAVLPFLHNRGKKDEFCFSEELFEDLKTFIMNRE